MYDKLRIRAEWSIRSGSVGLYLMEERGRDRLVGAPVEMKAHEPGVMIDPTTRITMEAAQELMDDLWSCGLRPREGAGSAEVPSRPPRTT